MSGDSVVLDCGSGFVKAGFAGEEAPRSIFPHYVVGNPKFKFFEEKVGKLPPSLNDGKSKFVIRRPIQRGAVQDWDDLEKVWNHTFKNELKVLPEEFPVFIVDSPQNSRSDRCREKMAEILFEKFNVPAFHVANSSVMSLLGQGKTTGVVVESGFGVTNVVPIYHGQTLHESEMSMAHSAGNDLTKFWKDIFQKSGFEYNEFEVEDIAKDLKELYACVALDFDAEMKSPSFPEDVYTLPDGQTLSIGSAERFVCTEVIFNPLVNGMEQDGISATIQKAVQKCGIDIRKDLYGEVLLSGGNTMFPGYAARLHKELSLLAPKANVVIDAPMERKDLAWYGASGYCTLSHFQENLWITKAEFEESGGSVIAKKCA
eukprot:TRINITY_DN4318_c0_g2_i2.p2 TRINITY_DN4318_c0_g2~~TRINITY_DN4318_c0_g2_i2.p2  ORF type:complete len:372 (-),score=105.06 TRINITY_DN4318_c0_g2_i2:1682-2797(-)